MARGLLDGTGGAGEINEVKELISLHKSPNGRSRFKLNEHFGFSKREESIIFKARDSLFNTDVMIKVILNSDDQNYRFTKAAYDVFKSVSNKDYISRLIGDEPLNLGKGYYAVIDTWGNADLQKYVQTYGLKHHTSKEWNTILMQPMIGVKYMHERNAIHCDIKPQNIIQYFDGGWAITDLSSMFLLEKIKSDTFSRTPRSTMQFWDYDLLDNQNNHYEQFFSFDSDIFSFGMCDFLLHSKKWLVPYQIDGVLKPELVRKHIEKLSISTIEKKRIIRATLPRAPLEPTHLDKPEDYRFTSLDLYISALKGKNISLPSFQKMGNSHEARNFLNTYDRLKKQLADVDKNRDWAAGLLNPEYVYSLNSQFQTFENLFKHPYVKNIPDLKDKFLKLGLHQKRIAREEAKIASENINKINVHNYHQSSIDTLCDISDLLYLWKDYDGWKTIEGGKRLASVSFSDIQKKKTPFRKRINTYRK